MDADVLAVDDIAYQVDVQNDKLEEQVDQLSNLLTYGLLDTPSRSSVMLLPPMRNPTQNASL